MKPKKPSHAERRWTIGLSSIVDIRSPILWRKEIRTKVMKKMIEQASARPKNTGVACVGAASKSLGAELGSADKSRETLERTYLARTARLRTITGVQCRARAIYTAIVF